MLRNLFVVCLLLIVKTIAAQVPVPYTGHFENINTVTRLPPGWKTWGASNTTRADSAVKLEGQYSLLVDPGKDQPVFTSPVGALPVTFTGREVTFSGYLRMENISKGFAGLILRIDDRDTTTLQFNNMLDKKLQGTADWKKYSITLPLPPDGVVIYAGVIYTGTGKLWADSLQIMVDGKDYALAPRATIPPAEVITKGNEFNRGSKITLDKASPQQLNDLAVLGKVWGFLKYYHPIVAKGTTNWDYELFRIMPGVLASKNTTERNERISAWIEGVGKVNKDSQWVKPADGHLLPDVDWINDEQELGVALSAQLQTIRQAKRQIYNYYAGYNRGVSGLFVNEKPYLKMLNPDTGYRLLCLFRFWNMVQYFSPYRKHMDEPWNAVLPAMIPEFIRAGNARDYQLAAMRLIAKVQDSHTQAFGRLNEADAFFGKSYTPFHLTMMEGRAVVTRLADSSLIKKGDVVLRINGEAVHQKLRKFAPYTGASNEHTFLRDVTRRLVQIPDTVAQITVERNGTAQIVTVPAISLNDWYGLYKPEGPEKDTGWKLLSPDVGYIYPGTLRLQQIPDMMKALRETKGIVIDMRCYPKDFIPYKLGEYLLPEEVPFTKITMPEIREPGLFKWMMPLRVGLKSNKKYYEGKIILLINETSQSRAEFTAMAIQQAPRLITLGSPSAGADGDVIDLVLPGGIRSRLSGYGIYYPDGRETQRCGLIPDVEMTPTLKAYREGRDELLEKAVSIILSEKPITTYRRSSNAR